MPEVDCPSFLINAESQNKRDNNSWILGRILRDWDENSLKDEFAEDYALVIIFCEQFPPKAGKPKIDRVWMSGDLTIVSHILISIVPGVISGQWTVLVITAGGTLECLAQSALRQWSAEKLECRRLTKGKSQTVTLTRGNGHNHVLVTHTTEGGLNIEDLAAGKVNKHRTTLPFTLALSVLWLIILLTAIAVQEKTWFLLLAGGIEMMQNIVAAGFRRSPVAVGIHLKPEKIIKPDRAGQDPSNKVFRVIQQAEEQAELKGVGLALLSVFLDGELFPNEKSWKEKPVKENEEEKAQDKANARPNKTA